ncbi:MAG: transcriptional regulator [Candidatus Woesearchaeota archaeon]
MVIDKKQLMPQEIEVWYVIPAIRRELVREMVKRGLKQKDIADSLGITGAAVSQYLRNKRAREVQFTEETLNEIKRSAGVISKDPQKLICEMQRILTIVKKNRTLCRVHHEHGRTPQKCEACLGINSG